MNTKRCGHCKTIRSLEEFPKNKRSKDGFDWTCKQCRIEYQQNRVFINVTEKLCKVCGKIKPISNFHNNSSVKDKHTNVCKLCTLEYQRNNKERLRKTRKAWIERIGGYSEHHKRYKQSVSRGNEKYNNSEKGKKKRVLASQDRRARKRNALGNFSQELFDIVCNYYAQNSVCPCCGMESKMTIDHVIPLAKGGLHSISNIQPLCLSCNLKKNDKMHDYRHDLGNFAKFLEIV